MKNLINKLSLLTLLLLLSALVINARHNHSQTDTTKQKQHHTINDTTKTHHHNIEHNLKTPDGKEIWNKYCPIRGGEVDVETPTVEYKGKNIGFCCPGCDKKFMENPEKYMKNLSKDGKSFVGKK